MNNFNELSNTDKYNYIQKIYPTKTLTYSLFDVNNNLINPEEPINMYPKIYIFSKQFKYLQHNNYIINKNNIKTLGDILQKTDLLLTDTTTKKYLEYIEVYDNHIISYIK